MATDLPLSDVRVLDLTVARAGPTAVRQLADWGADVVRVEAPTKASGVQLGGDRDTADFQNLHRNKRSLTIDLKTPAGQALFHRLALDADVVVENMRPPVKHRLRVDYDTLAAINPRLVYGSISGFGQDGPYGDRGGVDQIAQGLGGLMLITGAPGAGPMRVGVPIADLCAGIYLAVGILTALHHRERTGQGQWVQTSLLEAMVAMLDFQAARWTVDGEVAKQEGNNHPTMIPMGCFATADGFMNIAGPSGRLWRNFCEAIGLPELLTDPQYATNPLRSKNRDALNQSIAAALAQHSTAHWVEVLTQVGVPAGPVNTIDEVFADPQVQHLGLAASVNHPRRGPLDLVRNAVRMSGVTESTVRAPTPDLGQHTDAVLHEAGLSAAEIDELRRAGVL